MNLLLASWLATQTWLWSPAPTATAYRIYWQAGTPTQWCTNAFVVVQATACNAVECEGDIPEPPGDIVYITVSALNEFGESEWDHGVKVSCP